MKEDKKTKSDVWLDRILLWYLIYVLGIISGLFWTYMQKIV